VKSLPDMKMNIPALTGARCVAALSVLIAHAAPTTVFQGSLFYMHLAVPLALFGMCLFFVLSGFVIYLNYSTLFHEREFAAAIHSFAVARIARLVPTYGFLFLIVAATTSWDNVEAQGRNLYLFATLTQSWFPVGAGDVQAVHLFVGMAHTWSISTEFFFYLTFPIVALSLPRATALGPAILQAIAVAVFSISTLYLIWSTRTGWMPVFTGPLSENAIVNWVAYLSPYGRIWEFVLGALSARAFLAATSKPNINSCGRIAGIVSLACGAGIIVIAVASGANYDLFQITTFWQFIRLNFVAAPMIAWLLFYCCSTESLLSALLSLPVVVGIGECSYSIYLLHPVILPIFVAKSGAVLSVASLLEWTFKTAMAVVLITIAAYSMYHFVEVPARSWIRRRFLPRSRATSQTSSSLTITSV
jgi:peptidoglycan/LPS O-acetylase OafA/YrhL